MNSLYISICALAVSMAAIAIFFSILAAIPNRSTPPNQQVAEERLTGSVECVDLEAGILYSANLRTGAWTEVGAVVEDNAGGPGSENVLYGLQCSK